MGPEPARSEGASSWLPLLVIGVLGSALVLLFSTEPVIGSVGVRFGVWPALAVGGSVLGGILIGRWWALLLPPPIVVFLISQVESRPDELEGLRFVAMFYLSAFGVAGAAIGVSIQKLILR
jgi:hypothetical protein